MKLATTPWLALALTATLLSACGGAPDAASTPTMDGTLVYTQAAQTVAAQFTQTSAALTVNAPTQTNTPEPTITMAPTITSVATLNIFTQQPGVTQPPLGAPTHLFPLPGLGTPTAPLCNDSAYVRDVGTVDGSKLKPGQAFEKGWLIQNTGTCNWGIGYRLVHVGGNTNFGGDAFVIRFPSDIVLSGTITEISLRLVAPNKPGTYEARYQMYTNQEIPFGTAMTVAIEVQK